MSASLLGEEELKAKLVAMSARVNAANGPAAAAGAEVVARAFAEHAPRDTGATAESARVEKEGDAAYAGVSTDYARFTEYGTEYVTAQHWARQAYETSKEGAIGAFALVIREALRI
jgi:HK97 gp10 family phage protein